LITARRGQIGALPTVDEFAAAIVDAAGDSRRPGTCFSSGRLTDPKKSARTMQFILGVLVFVIVIGIIDAKLPWPKPRSKDRRP